MLSREHGPERDLDRDAVERAANERVDTALSRLFLALVLLAVPLASCATRKPGAWQPLPVPATLTPDGALVDTGPKGGERRGSRLPPATPEPWQKRPSGNPPSCGKKQYLINGACYRRAHPDDFSPPCEEPTVEWQGACYFAVQQETRPNTSLSR